jgi:molybdopterin converting factor small subunit
MEVKVEFAGLSRVITHRRSLSLTLDDGATYRDILHRLANRYPDLIGNVIHPSLESLQSSNMLNLNGKHMISPDQMNNNSPSEGDRIILMSVLAGG